MTTHDFTGFAIAAGVLGGLSGVIGCALSLLGRRRGDTFGVVAIGFAIAASAIGVSGTIWGIRATSQDVLGAHFSPASRD